MQSIDDLQSTTLVWMPPSVDIHIRVSSVLPKLRALFNGTCVLRQMNVRTSEANTQFAIRFFAHFRWSEIGYYFFFFGFFVNMSIWLCSEVQCDLCLTDEASVAELLIHASLCWPSNKSTTVIESAEEWTVANLSELWTINSTHRTTGGIFVHRLIDTEIHIRCVWLVQCVSYL